MEVGAVAVMRHEISAPRGGHERSSAARGMGLTAWLFSGAAEGVANALRATWTCLCASARCRGLDWTSARAAAVRRTGTTKPLRTGTYHRRRRARHSRRVDCILNAATDVGNGEVE